MKYIWWWKKKNGAEDLLKAEWYIPTVIEIGEQRYQLQHQDQYKRG